VLSVSVADEVDDELVAAMRRLVPQLSTSASLPGPAEVGEIIRSDATVLLVARDSSLADVEGDRGDASVLAGPIVGLLTLVVFRIPSGLRAWVEDVVVDAAARRRGVAEALTKAAIDLARSRGSVTLDLTSRPGRDAANRLYQKVGFEQRTTNVYRLELRKKA
jgi:ribosomal protein S18 acetylase RimI-like enzyme